MTEISYDPPQEGGRLARIKRLFSEVGAGVVLGGEINSGITLNERRPNSAKPVEKAVGMVALNGRSDISETEIQAMIDSVDASLLL